MERSQHAHGQMTNRMLSGGRNCSEDMAALGRPFTLGMLYNARTDRPIPGWAVWDQTTIQNLTVESRQHSSGFEVTASDSMEEKFLRLDVGSSLQASFMSGLIEVGGSAKYLEDEKESHLQSRVMFQYKATTVFKQLMLSSLKDSQIKNLLNVKNGATHVVTGILFGANAFFAFDSEKLEPGKTREVQDSMQAVMKKIPFFITDEKVDIKLTDQEKHVTDKFTCKFYGDFILQSLPVTFEDAVKTYVQLPKLLSQQGENGVPMKIWLTPLKIFDSNAPQVYGQVSCGILRPMSEALQGLQDVLMRCSSLLEDPVVLAFPQMQENLRVLQFLCKDFRGELQKEIAEMLLDVRAGKGEHEMIKVFHKMKHSFFSHWTLTRLMNRMTREVNVVRSCVDIMGSVKLVSDPSELDRKVLDPEVEEVFCFVFTSLGAPDPLLQELSEVVYTWLSSKINAFILPTVNPWNFSTEVVTRMRRKAKEFRDLIKAVGKSSSVRFLITAMDKGDQEGATISHYREAVLITDDYCQETMA